MLGRGTWLSLAEKEEERSGWRTEAKHCMTSSLQSWIPSQSLFCFPEGLGQSLPLPIYPEHRGPINPPKSLFTSHRSHSKESEVAPYCLLNQIWLLCLTCIDFRNSAFPSMSSSSQPPALSHHRRLLTLSCTDATFPSLRCCSSWCDYRSSLLYPASLSDPQGLCQAPPSPKMQPSDYSSLLWSLFSEPSIVLLEAYQQALWGWESEGISAFIYIHELIIDFSDIKNV